MSLKIDLKVLFEGYCRNFPIVYGGIYHWGKTETFSWLTNSILSFFRSMGRSLGFKIVMEKKNIGSLILQSQADLIWINDEDPFLHLECENASQWRHIEKELKNLGSSDIPFKVGIFQFVESTLRKTIMQRAVKYLERREFLENGTKWLLVFDMWYETGTEEVEYRYVDSETGETVNKKYMLEWYPLYGLILGERTEKMKLAKVYRLPFNKMGLVKDERWKRTSF